ncbi:MAG: fumarate hydratase, partial [Candidatus Omnitrophica bacterium]|nr:fumarate hydratase [Candidatus Omnitrophota bacterium]
MKKINSAVIRKTIAYLCIEANIQLRRDVISALKEAYKKESKRAAKDALMAIIKNADIAGKKDLAICQDTGMPYIFAEIGYKLRIIGNLKQAINQGVKAGYKKGFLRSSIIKNPLSRIKPGYVPAIIHLDFIKGSNLKLTVLAKGFGCENKSQIKMFNPTDKIEEIKKFIVQAVKTAGADACPPYVVGVGIGGTADYAGFLAKKALLRKIKNQKSNIKNTNQKFLPCRQAGKIKDRLERELLIAI